MRKLVIALFIFCLAFFSSSAVSAQQIGPLLETEPTITPRPDITQTTEEVAEPLGKLLESQKLGAVWPFNPIKYAIRASVEVGVAPTTVVLLLLLPVIAAFIAAARHIIGLRGFGIFLPASLAIVFLAIGPVLGILLFVVIVAVSTFSRLVLRKAKVKLQYLPRMSLLLLLVVIGVLNILFLAPVWKYPDLTNVSIFPVLILVLLAEDFSKVQLGKSARTAVTLATETLILSLLSYTFLIMDPLRVFALLHPESLLVAVLVVDLVLGKYTGLRVAEYWRYRKLLRGK